jgi:hypothetical protein
MKTTAAAFLSLVFLCGVFAPIVSGCSDEKTASPPNSPTGPASQKQAVVNGDGGGGGGGGGGNTGGGW